MPREEPQFQVGQTHDDLVYQQADQSLLFGQEQLVSDVIDLVMATVT